MKCADNELPLPESLTLIESLKTPCSPPAPTPHPFRIPGVAGAPAKNGLLLGQGASKAILPQSLQLLDRQHLSITLPHTEETTGTAEVSIKESKCRGRSYSGGNAKRCLQSNMSATTNKPSNKTRVIKLDKQRSILPTQGKCCCFQTHSR